MVMAWIAERIGLSMVMFTIVWILGCCWNNLKLNQRLALGDAFENSHRCVYMRIGGEAERDHLLSGAARSV
jgi:hypothetical protein